MSADIQAALLRGHRAVSHNNDIVSETRDEEKKTFSFKNRNSERTCAAKYCK